VIGSRCSTLEFPAGKNCTHLQCRCRISGRNSAATGDRPDGAVAAAARRSPPYGDLDELRTDGLRARHGSRRQPPHTDPAVPVGEATLGLHVLTCPWESRWHELGPVTSKTDRLNPPRSSKLHRSGNQPKVFETGIKVIDLLAPPPRQARSACLAGAGRRHRCLLPGADPTTSPNGARRRPRFRWLCASAPGGSTTSTKSSRNPE